MTNTDRLSHELLPRDDLENEWWYYHGHLASDGHHFGFHLVFFRRRTDRIYVGSLLPVRLVNSHIRFAHFALTDLSTRRFHYGHQRSVRGNAGAAADRYEVWIRDWSVREVQGNHHLRARIRGAELDLVVRPLKPPVRHGREGFFSKVDHGHSTYLSYPRMDAAGQLILGGQERTVTGQAWMDREFGDFGFEQQLHGWDWFALQFEDGRELMACRLRDRHGTPTRHSKGTLIEADASVEHLAADQFLITPLERWSSPYTGNVYPVGWRVEVTSIEACLLVESCLTCHELDTRGSTGVIYWEGPVHVRGTCRRRAVQGRGYVELVGYERATRRLGLYDFSRNNLSLLGWLSNELRLRWFGPGVTRTEPG